MESIITVIKGLHLWENLLVSAGIAVVITLLFYVGFKIFGKRGKQ